MQHRLLEPPIQVLAAAVARRHGLLRVAIPTFRRAAHADMEVVGMPPIGSHLIEPGAGIAGVAAQGFFDGRIDEDAFDLRLFGGGLDQSGVPRRSDFRVDVFAILGDHADSRHLLTFFPRVSSRSGIGVNQISASRPT